jgi:hypothetical protein
MSASWLSAVELAMSWSVSVIDTVQIGLLLAVLMSFVDRANQQHRYDTTC